VVAAGRFVGLRHRGLHQCGPRGTAIAQAQAGPCLSPACGSEEAERVVVERGGGERAEQAVGDGGARSRQRKSAEQAVGGGRARSRQRRIAKQAASGGGSRSRRRVAEERMRAGGG